MKNPNKLVVERIYEEIKKISKENKGERIVVTLDGTSGVGKTSIAKQLKNKMNDNITIIHGDTLIVSYRNRYSRMKKNLDTPEVVYESLWFNKNIKNRIKTAILNNKTDYKYNFIKTSRKKIISVDLSKNIILIEGCFVSHENNFGDISDLKIILHMHRQDIENRRKSRRKILRCETNNVKFVKIFDRIFQFYMDKYNIVDKSQLKIFTHYK